MKTKILVPLYWRKSQIDEGHFLNKHLLLLFCQLNLSKIFILSDYFVIYYMLFICNKVWELKKFTEMLLNFKFVKI